MLLKIKDWARTKAALGATLAEQHMSGLANQIAEGTLKPGTTVVLDFDGVRETNGSYIRATAYWLLMCGQLFCTGQRLNPRHPADPRPYDVFVCVTGLGDGVVVEFREFFDPRPIPILHATGLKNEQISEAMMIGGLEQALQMTLRALVKYPGSTAPELNAKHPDQHVTPTAWNNRLNDLWTLRLVTRNRCGRAWQYQPLAKKIIWE